MNSTHSLLVAAALVSSTASLAQDPAAARHLTGQPSVVQGRSCGLAAQDGVLVAVGADYKAAFLPTGIAFTPALGERAPHNLPLRLDLESIGRGDTVLHDGRDVPPAGAGLRVVYDHGAIVERYDVGAAGIEQSFVFAERPAGKGDLVVRCRTDSELTARANGDGTLSFRREELGGVRIGQVTGIAANGARCAGMLRLDGGAIELSLPAAFVDEAPLPLVLDPVIGTEFLVYSANDGYDPDSAYDEASDRYLVVWNRRYSFTDIDVYAQRVSAASGALVGGTLIVDATVSTVRRPRAAYVHAAQRCLVVWQRSASPLGPWDVECRSVSVVDGAMSAIVAVATTAADEFAPVVGGDATGSDDEAIVVWETDAGIQACQMTLLLPDPVPTASVMLSTSVLDNTPAISKTCGASLRHVVVWQRSQLLSDAEIVAQAVDRNLALQGGLSTVTANTVTDGAPAVDGNGTTFMVAWERTEASGSTRDIACATLTFTGSGLAVATAETALEATRGEDEYAPDIAILGSRFCVVYAERAGALLDDCHAWLVNTNCTTCNAKIGLDGLNGAGWNRESSPRIASEFVSTGDDTALIAFNEALDAPPFTSRVVAQRVENQSAGTPPVPVSGACGGGIAGASGPFVVGNAGFQFTLSGADPAGVLFLSLGFPGPGLPCGACSLTQPVSFDFKPNLGGSAISLFAIPCDPAYVGTTLEFQWVAFNTAVNSCPAAPGLATTRRMQVTLEN
jgi:hypothetical protein